MTSASTVLVIGAGAAGAALSWRLAQRGLEVTCLEQGIHQDRSNYPSNFSEWEILKLTTYNSNPNVRNSKYDYPINNNSSPIEIANFCGVGGSTILFSGHFPRFHASDFHSFTLDGVGADWPIDLDALNPYYDLNEANIGVSGLVGDPVYPNIKKLLPPVPLGKMGEEVGKGFNKLGWHWWPSYSAINTDSNFDRPKCINIGPCNTGCAHGAKSSADTTYWPAAIKLGVNLVTEARVRTIKLKNRNTASSVTYFDAKGEIREIEADIIVLAASGIGTPRILLNSKSTYFPNGLANSSGLVGRNLMLHPLGFISGILDENLDSNLGPQGCCIASHQFCEDIPNENFKRGFTMQVLRGPGPLEWATNLLKRKKLLLGSDFQSQWQSEFNKTISIATIIEDLPETSNFVSLDSKLSDAFGIPAPKINYKLSENSKKMLAFSLKKGRELVNAVGGKTDLVFGPVKNTGWHTMGTARMGNDPESSVVNEYGQTHDVRNLYIADSSIFVTSSSVNPAATIQALALRIADGIADRYVK